ncbi:hypothetical protein [Pelagibius sp.]|uniref:hypothetical protein n=1 Tax=Pelagibius sp. TaxID=1931238 RepID=UPI003BB0A7D9
MGDEEFLHRLADCSLPKDEFNHRGHVRAAYLVLNETEGFGAALARMRRLITAYAESIGKAGLYHETITVASMALINQRIAESGESLSWEAFAAANPDLFEKEILATRYETATLKSDLARQVFLLPG